MALSQSTTEKLFDTTSRWQSHWSNIDDDDDNVGDDGNDDGNDDEEIKSFYDGLQRGQLMAGVVANSVKEQA